MPKVPCIYPEEHSEHAIGLVEHDCYRCGKKILWGSHLCFDCGSRPRERSRIADYVGGNGAATDRKATGTE